MKIKITFSFLLLIYQFVYAQNCDFKIRKIKNQIDITYHVIDRKSYEQVKQSEKTFERYMAISESELCEKYPSIFDLKNSCYSFKTIDGDSLKICNQDGNIRDFMCYDVESIACNHAIISFSAYEYSGFVSVDLSNQLAFFTMGKPQNLNCKTFFSYANYYLEEEITFTNLKTKKQSILGIEGWRTVETKMNENGYYMKLKSFENCKNELVYLQISTNN